MDFFFKRNVFRAVPNSDQLQKVKTIGQRIVEDVAGAAGGSHGGSSM